MVSIKRTWKNNERFQCEYCNRIFCNNKSKKEHRLFLHGKYEDLI